MNQFKSERIFLREIEITDISKRVIKWFEDEELMKYYTNTKSKITRDSLINSIEEGRKNRNVFTYGVFDTKSSDLIGTIKLGPINQSQKISDLVILIGDRNFLGKGLSVEAIKLGNRLAFELFDIRKLFGGMYELNIPSIKAYTRAGWVIEGRLYGHYWVDGKSQDRILVGCFNPSYFTKKEIKTVEANEHRYV